MKAPRFLRALPLALLLISPVRADQGSIVVPTSGPKTAAELMTAVNAALLAIQSCNSGTAAPANGPAGAPKAFQCWADTSAAPVVSYKFYDGASWVTFGQLNTSTHVWTPFRSGAAVAAVATSSSASDLTTGTLSAARMPAPTASTLGGVQSLTCSTSNWMRTISTAGAPGCSQPAFSDLTGSVAAAQMPALTGDVTTPAGGVATTIGANKVLDGMLRQGGALSLIGRSADTTGNVADISAVAASSCAFRESSNTIGCGTLATAAYAANSVTNPKLAQMANGATKCRTTAGTGDPEDCTAAQMRALLSLVIGTNVQAWDADLDAFALKSAPTGAVVGTTDTQTLTNKTLTAPAISAPTGIVKGDVGLGNVDNTSDINKPVSTAQAAADALKVNLTRNVATGCGLTGGGDLSADRTLRSIQSINAQTGTSYTLLAADCGKLVTFSNAAAQAVTLDSALGGGYWVEVSSLAAGTVTLTPSSGNIDGAANLTLSQGDGVRIILDGTNWRSVRGRAGGAGGTVSSVFTRTGAITAASGDYSAAQIGATGVFYKINVVKFTTPGTATYTPSAGLVYAAIECLGGGGGGSGAGGGATAGYGGGGGGSGSLSRKVASASAIGASQSVTIGSGGTAGSAGLTAGGAGGDSSVGTLCVGKGGGGGGPYYAGSAPTAALGGVAGTGDVTGNGAPGGAGWYSIGSVAVSISGMGGSSMLGGGGAAITAVNTATAGNAGTGYGAGGGGGAAANATTVAGGAGAPGIAIITEFLNQ
ncbi:MAG: hypothetical protein CFE29_03230 [Bradyrhizobiaceae bacterium PARB1]|nr:MAG: hypothetical protein CFE29_03230 [Bradyrhizobiaceae bacterium PARB1]